METREYLKQLARPEHQSYHPIRGKLDEESSRMTRDATTKTPEHLSHIPLPTENDKQDVHDARIANHPASLLQSTTELDKTKDETTTEKRILQGSRIARDTPHENVNSQHEHEFPAHLLHESVDKQETTTEKRVRRLADSSSSSSSEEDGYQGEEEIEKRKDDHRHTRNTSEDNERKGSKHIPVAQTAHPDTVSNQHQDKRHRREVVREIP